MKGIILAGGYGSRLQPLTLAISKQLLPIYDKPLIYYPLSTLMLAGIKDILIITMPDEMERFKRLLKNGNQWGISIVYAIQPEPKGLAQAFIIGEEFIGKDPVCLILGDNIFFGHDLAKLLSSAAELKKGGIIFGYYVTDPQRYGVIEFSTNGDVKAIIEKPSQPPSNYAAVGLYFYDNQVIQIAKKIKPSWRNELEITDVNNEYLNRKELKVMLMGRGFAWLDTGTPQSLIDAALFVKTIEDRQGLKIACIEEIAFRQGFINQSQLVLLAQEQKNPEYRDYLLKVKS